MSERLRRFLSELRHRRVLHAAAVYGSAAFIVIQAAALTFQALHFGPWPLTVVVVTAIVGFPVVLVVAWAFEISPEGLKRTESWDESTTRLVRPRESLRHDLALVALVCVVSVALAWAGWTVWFEPMRQLDADTRAQVPMEPRSFDHRRVAVNYLEDNSAGAELSYLARGLTDRLIHELEKIEPLDVISPNGVKRFRGTDLPLDSVARALEVGSWVEGSVQGSEDEIQVTAQLVDANTGSLMESIRVSRPRGELFALQDEVVTQVVDGLRRRLGTLVRHREQQHETESVEAWTLLQRAEEMKDAAARLREAGAPDAASVRIARADSLLQRAAELDSAWIDPVVLRGRLALTRAELASSEPLTFDSSWLEKGIDHAETALSRSPGHPTALELRGMARLRLALGDHGSKELRRLAERDLRAAVEAESSRARAWSELTAVLRLQGQFAEASLAAEKAFEADRYLTLSPTFEEIVLRRLYETQLELKNLSAARRWCSEAHRAFPSRSWTSGCKLFTLALAGEPEPDTAWMLLDSMLANTPAPEMKKNRAVGHLYVASVIARRARLADQDTAGHDRVDSDDGPLSGQLADSARAVIERARRPVSRRDELLSSWLDYHEAHTRLLLEERDSALTLLRSFLETQPDMADHLKVDWAFEDLHGDPRFERLAQEGS